MCSACSAMVACRTLRGKKLRLPPAAGSDYRYGHSALFSLSRRRKAKHRRVAQSHSRSFEAKRDHFNFSLRHKAVQPPFRRLQVEFSRQNASYPVLVYIEPAEQGCPCFRACRQPPRGSHSLPGVATCPSTRWGRLRLARTIPDGKSFHLPL